MKDRELKMMQSFKKFLKVLDCFYDDKKMEYDTSERVAKMYYREIFAGLYSQCPTAERTETRYKDIIIQKDINVNTVCKHHFLPVMCNVTIAYYPMQGIVGLSKLNRIAVWCGARPCLQEDLTNLIHGKISEATASDTVAVFVNATHFCVKMRGIKHINSVMKTKKLSGDFNPRNHPEGYRELIDHINHA